MNRVFDLTQHVSIQSSLLWAGAGALQLANGVLNIVGGEHMILGATMVCVGVLMLPGSLLRKRASRFVITFDHDSIRVQRGLFANHQIAWDSIAEISLSLMSAIIVTKSGRSRTLNFGELGYTANQMVKPQICAAIKEFGQEKGVSVTEVRSA